MSPSITVRYSVVTFLSPVIRFCQTFTSSLIFVEISFDFVFAYPCVFNLFVPLRVRCIILYKSFKESLSSSSINFCKVTQNSKSFDYFSKSIFFLIIAKSLYEIQYLFVAREHWHRLIDALYTIKFILMFKNLPSFSNISLIFFFNCQDDELQ